MPGNDQSSTPPPEPDSSPDLSFSVPAASTETVITVSDPSGPPGGAAPTEVTVGAGAAAGQSQSAGSPTPPPPEGSASSGSIAADPDAEFIAHIGDHTAPADGGPDLPSELVPGGAPTRHRSARRARSRGRDPIRDWFLTVLLGIGILRHEADDDEPPIVQWSRTIVIMVLVVTAITAGIVFGFVLSSDSSTSRTSPPAQSVPSASPSGVTTPSSPAVTGPISGGLSGLTVAKNEITFGTPAATQQVCQSGGSLTVTILIDGVPANTPVAVRLSGPGVPSGFTFETQPNTPTARSFPISGAGQWSDDIVSIGGQPAPSNRGLLSASGVVQC